MADEQWIAHETNSFKLEDTVIVTTGEWKGEIGKLGIFSGDYERALVYFYVTNELTKRMDIEDAIIPLDHLALYKDPHQLIRPLCVGDSVFIKEELLVTFGQNALRYRGKCLMIEDIFLESYKDSGRTFYRIEGIPWVIENIDILKTNPLLSKKYAFDKKPPTLPTI